ncbi:SDR family NAD(P)-dependent oxidoreductase [Lichenicoccus roseus]|uniref:SDR family NAD(P)-dependent oxidoreductase n=1 Tax=Lichenicoccus roseus TaxID=2683649 RepID=A0A5R9J5B8_9PROT|nr:SDR family NAD(P)-dependent oxidoreductase [Lichenicoccus roseus]TLU71707.1 SDR family NAD(P)-dependent oxidoreductase [Lichenicoccus roseus]
MLALIIGASRGLGLGLAREYLQRGWDVIGTVRPGAAQGPLHALAKEHARLSLAEADVTRPATFAGLDDAVGGRPLDLLFVVAGISNGPGETLSDITDEAFAHILLTNALGPMRAVRALAPLVAKPDGVIAVMTSGLGSVANNTSGGWTGYRASKAALNTMLRSYAAENKGDPRAMLAIDPGWVRTDMGGADATLDVETSARGMANAIAARAGSPGSQYVSYENKDIAW